MFSFLSRRRTPLINEEGEDAGREDRASTKRPTSLELCAQLALICACIVILFFGLSVTAVGFWGYHTQKDYLSITDNDSDLTRLPFSMMVTGVFVSLLGLVGLTGSIFSRTLTGQTLLGVFSFVLVLVIISEVGAGAAAIKLRSDLQKSFISNAEESQKMYGTNPTVTKSWDKFQAKYKCCGAKGYEGEKPPYFKVFHNESVPLSCCNCSIESSETCEDEELCKTYTNNATLHQQYIYKDGCTSRVVGSITDKVTVIAIIAIAVGSTQFLAVFLAVVVAYMSSKLEQEKTSYSYNKLLQQEENVSQATPS